MYRIAFVASVGHWVIKLQNWYFGWDTVKQPDGDVAYFKFHWEAQKYVNSVGIDKVYTDYTELARASIYR
jgi:hypothetical protein